ncbi:thiamine transport system ATP-binding protein [Erwinia toletana]|uniref:Thiamine transport system ATP-binding protein n=1 Tax=Winslowiella toletana TaxID=92490 RepID=A0ABS4PAW5_9GAMM|nr:thiamine ABC transporter ATP-binding protein ThiQ [Winslowiella toletana]MBP2169752.1 thiamine transport system ATP-binding protein [Winslowiella toletana]
MLTLNNLTYLYQHLPMRFSLSMQAGERLAILGPSGAGKSTLLSLIAGFLPASSGTMTLNGSDHTHSAPAQRPVSMLFQENNLFPHLSVAQNIGLGLHPGLKLNAQQKQAINAIAQRVGLSDYLERLPSQLSGGQRQRAALARCLVRQQPLLLLDEPFSALDPALRKEMLRLVDEVCRERKITLLMVSHSLEDAQQIAARSVLIVDGRVYWDGATATLAAGETREAEILGVTVK